MTKEQDEFIEQYIQKINKKNAVPRILMTIILAVGLALLGFWIVQTAFGILGIDLTLWQACIVTVASQILIGRGY